MKRSLLAVAILIAGAGAAWAQNDPVVARLTFFDGQIEVIRQGIPLALYPQVPIFDGDIVNTKDGRATLMFGDRSQVQVKSNSRLGISQVAGRREIDVIFGRLWAFVTEVNVSLERCVVVIHFSRQRLWNPRYCAVLIDPSERWPGS